MVKKDFKPTLCKGDIVIPEYGIMENALVYLRLEAEICLNHQRQKRCEALADKCLVLMMLCADKNKTDKSNFYKKWYITWSKLARQFKESYIWKM